MQVSRRNVTRAALWSAPALIATSAAPALAVSADKQAGQVVAVLWSNTFSDVGQGKTTGTDKHYQPWIIYPTATKTGSNTLVVTNATAASTLGSAQKGTGKLTPAPASKSGYYEQVGKGQQIHVVIENIGDTSSPGSDEYADVPRISQEDVPRGTRYTRGTAANPAWPSLVMRDQGWYSVMQGTRSTSDGNHWFGVRSKGANGRTKWDLTLQLNQNFTSPNDGASAVTFDLFWPSRLPATFPKRISAKLIYRVTVTSPWGTVVYTTSPI